MLPAATTPSSAHPVAKPQQVQHQYGTRIRSNSVMRPSARLRQNTDSPAPPRRIKPQPVAKGKAPAATNPSPPPPDFPIFPPPNVMLHSEDANSKVLLAIGRSFVSVDNKAMTIKDLAEMTMKFGLMCQNVSAAGQAITTYIRNHLQRCETQQDHPLLLRHVLSGTPSDDELVPALHSRTGGAHCTLSPTDNRVTNFRRGTMVWYLSKAAGAPCPFARAGIRLCDYGENGKKGEEVNPGKERKRERDRLRRAEQCGQKRKRLPRACADRRSSSDSDSSEDEEPESKRPLTLRLPALSLSAEPSSRSSSPAEVFDLSRSFDSDSEEESMSDDSSTASDEEDTQEQDEDKLDPAEDAWHHPLYRRRSASIPRTVPPTDGPRSDMHASTSVSHESLERSWRSLSVPRSAASPPPDTEDEDYDMALDDPSGSSVHWDSDDMFADFDFGAETDTQWDSPGPMSPPSQFHDEDVIVKQEPRDVQGLLDSWDGLDSRVVDIVARAAAEELQREAPKVKSEDDFGLEDMWHAIAGPGLNDFVDNPEAERATFIKEEDDDDALSFRERYSSSPSMSPMTPFTPFSPSTSYFRYVPISKPLDQRRDNEFSWADAELFSPQDVKPHDLDNGVYQEGEFKRERSPSKEPSSTVSPGSSASMTPSLESSRSSVVPLDAPVAELKEQYSSVLTPNPPSPLSSDDDVPSIIALRHIQESSESSQSSEKDENVVVDTLTPCVPAIWATTFEGISVYQMVLGSSHIFRRIDTDFVNMSPVLQFLGLPHPDPEKLISAVVISRGDPLVCGTWVDLATARSMVEDEPLVKTFLSEELHKKFPQALQDFHLSSQQGRSLKQFGPHFSSTVDADARREAVVHSFRMELPPRMRRWAVEDHLLSVHPPFALRAAMVAVKPDEVVVPETPLSPTEEEMFRTLCSASDWDASQESPAEAPEVAEAEVGTEAEVKSVESVAESGDAIESVPLPEPEEVTEELTNEGESEQATTGEASEQPASEVAVTETSPSREREKERECERPLRRSKRVANAAFIRSRTRSAAKRGSRTLS